MRLKLPRKDNSEQLRSMDSSFDMLNRTSYYSYPLSDVSSFRPTNHPITTNDYYPDHPSIVYTNSRSQSPLNHPGVERSTPSSLILSRRDHCLICSDRASGIHFGVSTCEACKAFFRRTSLSSYSIALPCSPVRCEINIKNRNNCPSCRFDKCKRLGMDRENVIYGKPCKQPIVHQDYFIEQLTNISHQLIKTFQEINHTFDHKLPMETFGRLASDLFYPQIHLNTSEIVLKIFNLISQNIPMIDYCFIQHNHLRAILSLWLFVYYYETFLFKEKISQEKLTILVKLLDMELMKINKYDEDQQKFFRIDFMNTFTKFSDLLLQQIHLEY